MDFSLSPDHEILRDSVRRFVEREIKPVESELDKKEAFLFVMDGVVALQLGEEKLELARGDSVYYLSTTPHLVAAKSGKAAVLAVLYEG